MAAARTAKQKAALRKAQIASAKKRKRRALVRNTGRGIVGKKNGSRKKRYKVARYAGGLAAAGAVAYGHHKLKGHLKNNSYHATVVGSTKYSRNDNPRKGKRVQIHHTRGVKGGALHGLGIKNSVSGSVHFRGRDYRFLANRRKR